MNAERIMRKGMRMVSCRPDEALRTALSRMERSGMAALPVVDQDGVLVGMVDRDAALAKRTSFVASAMTRKVFCCRVNDTLSDVEASLREQNLDTIPVIDDDGSLRGVVSMADLPWAARKGTVPVKSLDGADTVPLSTLAS